MIDSNIQLQIYILSTLHLAVGVGYYFFYGKRKVLPSHAFVLASVIFLAIPGFYDDYTGLLSIDTMRLVSFVSLLCTVCIVVIVRYGTRRKIAEYVIATRKFQIDRYENVKLKSYIYLSLIFVVFVYIAEYYGVHVGPLKERTLNVAVIILFTWFISASFNRALLFYHGLIFVIFLYLYVISSVDGTGRLILASLLFSLFLIYSVFTNLRIKYYSIPVLLVLVVIFAILRSDGSVGIGDIFVERAGLQSVYAPYVTFGRVIQYFDLGFRDYFYGETYLASAVAWFPRALWATKPEGFGYELTLIFAPHLEAIGYSMAASYLGELYANGAFFLVVLGVGVIGILLRKFDMLWIEFILDQRDRGFITLIVYAIVASGLFNFVWVGAYTFSGREGMKLVVLFAIVGFHRVWISLTGRR